MAAHVQNVHNNASTNNGAVAVSTAAVAVGNLLVVQVYHSGSTTNAVVTDNQSGTYTRVASAVKVSSADTMGFYVRDALTANTNVHIVTTTPTTSTGGGIQVTEFSGFTRTGASAALQTAQQDNQASGTPAPAFGSAANTNNVILGGVMNGANPATLTPPSGFTERRDSGYNTPTTGFEAVTEDSGFTGTTVTWGSSSGTAFCSLIVELDTSAVAGNVTVTPDVATLTTATFAPTVTASNHQLVTPTTLALTTAKFAPVLKLQVTATTAALTTTAFAPTVATSSNQLLTPTTATLVTATFAATIAHRINAASPTALVLATFAPTAAVSNNIVVTPTTAAPGLTTFAPTVTGGAGLTVVPTNAALVTAAFAPTVTATANQLVTPGFASLTTAAFAPVLKLVVTPTPTALGLTTFAPVITLRLTVTPTTASLSLTTFAPVLTVRAEVVPATASLTTNTFAPVLGWKVIAGNASLTLATFAPTATVMEAQAVIATASAFIREVQPVGTQILAVVGSGSSIITATVDQSSIEEVK